MNSSWVFPRSMVFQSSQNISITLIISRIKYSLVLSPGTYLYIKSDRNRTGTVATIRMTSQGTITQGWARIVFAYHMLDNRPPDRLGTLRLQACGQDLWSRTGNQSRFWLKAAMTFQCDQTRPEVRYNYVWKFSHPPSPQKINTLSMLAVIIPTQSQDVIITCVNKRWVSPHSLLRWCYKGWASIFSGSRYPLRWIR